MTGELWNAQLERAPSHLVSLGGGFVGALFDGEAWISPPSTEPVSHLIETARAYGRPIIIGPLGRAFFQIELCALLWPLSRDGFERLGKLIKSKLWRSVVPTRNN